MQMGVGTTWHRHLSQHKTLPVSYGCLPDGLLGAIFGQSLVNVGEPLPGPWQEGSYMHERQAVPS